MLVAAESDGSILRFDETTGAYLGTFVPPHSGGLVHPVGLGFGRDGNLYVTDNATAQILRYNGQNGTFQDRFATNGVPFPAAMTFGSDGDIYVEINSGSGSGNIAIIDGTDGTVRGHLGNASLHYPQGLRFGPDGALYVADQSAGVWRFDGTNWGAFVLPTALPAGANPQDLTFGGDGNLYVSDGINAVFRFNGTNGSPTVPAPFASGGGLGTSVGVGFGPDGNLYVVSNNYNQRGVPGIMRYNGTSGAFLGAITSGVSRYGMQYLAFMPPLKASIRVSEVEIAWNSVSNTTYRVDYTSTLTTNQWTPLVACIQAQGTSTRVYDKVNLGEPQRFYRVAVTSCVPSP